MSKVLSSLLEVLPYLCTCGFHYPTTHTALIDLCGISGGTVAWVKCQACSLSTGDKLEKECFSFYAEKNGLMEWAGPEFILLGQLQVLPRKLWELAYFHMTCLCVQLFQPITDSLNIQTQGQTPLKSVLSFSSP